MTAHAILRAKERLGVDIDQRDLDAALALRGRSHRAVFVQRESNGKEHWIVPLKGVSAGIVISADLRTVVTVMTPGQITTAGKRGEIPCKSTRAQKRRGNWSTRADRLMKREEFGEA